MSTCCSQAAHAALKADRARWEAQRHLGHQIAEFDEGREVYDVRNCVVCESTLYLRLPPAEALAVLNTVDTRAA